MSGNPKLMLPPDKFDLIEKVSLSLDADVILYTGPIDYPYDHAFINKVRTHHQKPNALVVLTTSGGSADSAYRMMRLLQHHYVGGRTIVAVADRCKSAGTLMAIGADEIIMMDDAEFGPLDVQVMKPDEFGEYTSGLTAFQALTALRNEAFQSFEQFFLRLRGSSGFQITTKTAALIAARLATGGIQKLYDQLDPMRIAEHQRAMTIAQEYGQRLNRGILRPDALDRLITDYPSHGFMIDFVEAQTLFSKVRLPSEAEFSFLEFLVMSTLCMEPTVASEPKIIYLLQEFGTAVADKGQDGKDETNETEQPPKVPEAAIGTGVPADSAGNANTNRASRGGGPTRAKSTNRRSVRGAARTASRDGIPVDGQSAD